MEISHSFIQVETKINHFALGRVETSSQGTWLPQFNKTSSHGHQPLSKSLSCTIKHATWAARGEVGSGLMFVCLWIPEKSAFKHLAKVLCAANPAVLPLLGQCWMLLRPGVVLPAVSSGLCIDHRWKILITWAHLVLEWPTEALPTVPWAARLGNVGPIDEANVVLAQRKAPGETSLIKRISNSSFCRVCSSNTHYTTIKWFVVEGTLKDHLDAAWIVLQGITTMVP